MEQNVECDKTNDDSVTVPNKVVNIMVSKNVSLMKAWRLHSGLTQKDVASAIGKSQATISRYESNQRSDLDVISDMSKVYNCSVAQLKL